MNKVYTIFSEILKLCPRYYFDKAVKEYHGDRYVKTFTTWQQFMTILYSQITQKDSLRDIVTMHPGGITLGLLGYIRARCLMRMPNGTTGCLRSCFITYWAAART